MSDNTETQCAECARRDHDRRVALEVMIAILAGIILACIAGVLGVLA